MNGSIGRIEEGRTRNEIHQNIEIKQEGFEIDENIDEDPSMF